MSVDIKGSWEQRQMLSSRLMKMRWEAHIWSKACVATALLL